jgi:hypothetical protein
MDVAVGVEPDQCRVQTAPLQPDESAEGGEAVTRHNSRQATHLSALRYLIRKCVVQRDEACPLVSFGEIGIDDLGRIAGGEREAAVGESLVLVVRQRDHAVHVQQTTAEA